MTFNSLIRLSAVRAIVFAVFSLSILGQAPRQEKLLNGLKVLMWNDDKADKVSLTVRVHSGSAFDPQGKEGVMKLLAQHLFPNKEAQEFFREELGGSLSVESNYDFIQINASSRPDKFLQLLETVANAINNLTVDKESLAKAKAEQLELVRQFNRDPAYVADSAVAVRLLGTFPYGRPQNGTVESLGRIDFADLIFARDRFLTADNATVAISGKFDSALGFRALRRYFGNWLKADKKTPTAFRQPDDPDTKLLNVKFDSQGTTQYRSAIRGVARNDKDYAAAQILSRIYESRLTALASKNGAGSVFVRNEAHVLPGVVIFGYSGSSNLPPNLVSLVLGAPITSEEFARVRPEIATEVSKRTPADWWLDAETYKLASATDDMRSLDAVTVSDVQRVHERLAKNPVAAVSVIPSATPSSN